MFYGLSISGTIYEVEILYTTQFLSHSIKKTILIDPEDATKNIQINDEYLDIELIFCQNDKKEMIVQAYFHRPLMKSALILLKPYGTMVHRIEQKNKSLIHAFLPLLGRALDRVLGKDKELL
jgi:hypothetical protein